MIGQRLRGSLHLATTLAGSDAMHQSPSTQFGLKTFLKDRRNGDDLSIFGGGNSTVTGQQESRPLPTLLSDTFKEGGRTMFSAGSTYFPPLQAQFPGALVYIFDNLGEGMCSVSFTIPDTEYFKDPKCLILFWVFFLKHIST